MQVVSTNEVKLAEREQVPYSEALQQTRPKPTVGEIIWMVLFLALVVADYLLVCGVIRKISQ
jgi:hypothetical protein